MKCELKDVAEIYDGTHQTPKYQSHGIMFLSVENITNLSSKKYISQEAFDSEFSIRPEKGDVLMTRIGDIGTANVVESEQPIAYYVSLALFKSTKLNPYFLKNSIHSPEMINDIWRRTLHIAFPKKINKNEIGNVSIYVPTIDEQTKIGYLFNSLDDLITVNERELNKLKDLKKSYLEKMFPKNGSDIPELRFPGYADAWVKCELGDVVKKIKSYSLSRDVETDKHTGYKYIHYGDIHTNVAGYIDEESILPNIKADDFDILDAGDLIVADASEDYQGIAKPAVLVVKPTSNVVAGLHTIALRPTHSNSIFLYYLLQTDLFKQFGKKAGTGMKVFGITFSNLSKFHTSFPTEDEQHKIGKFLHSIDDLITVNERELNKLKELKKSYLKDMFV